MTEQQIFYIFGELLKAGCSTRQAIVVKHLLHGLKNEEIADQMNVTEKTVKSHFTGIYKRLGISDRVNLVLWCFKVLREK